jgi:hypothetical protein
MRSKSACWRARVSTVKPDPKRFHNIASKAHPNVANYVNNRLKDVTNLNNEKIKQLLGSFNSDWVKIINENILDDQKDAIDSILANRHQIAHGKSVGITYARVVRYYLAVQ